jgi:para-aminobenzoate synthetase
MSPVRTLLLDNYDSFTFNLFQLLAQVNGEEPVVVRHDAAAWAELDAGGFDNIVISPGPGRPQRAADFGVCADAVRAARVPLLGVCLGHQGLGWSCGAEVVDAPEVMHGRLSAVHHDGSPLFAGIPQGFRAVRYHSLCVARPLPPELRVVAWTPDGVVMALARRDRPAWGVQFHPESICTEHGRRLLENFRDLTLAARNGHRRAARGGPRRVARPTGGNGAAPRELRLQVARLDAPPDAERAFVDLFGDARHAFWLDSSRVADRRSRFSFMGAAAGPESAVVTYDAAAGALRVERHGRVEVRRETIFDHLRDELHRVRVVDPPPLPFDFDAGYVGWLGYELKSDCGGEAAHASTVPDAALLLADRLLVLDHLEGCAYLVCLTDRRSAAEGERWIERTRRRLGDLPPLAEPAFPPPGADGTLAFRLSRSREGYLEDIRRCHRLLAEGETYEVCLTNRLSTDAAPDPLTLYRTLRRINPAPFSAFLRMDGVAVLSSSPERFLQVRPDRSVEAKPIKGTIRRGAGAAEDRQLAESLRTSEKDRAENLMITDLLRNDLGIVCEVGSVRVPHLMAIESFETVHQLVSTVTGRLRDGLSAVDCVQACFPGGSMTGAPKKRTMEIIDALELEARGVYSGAIGYFGLGGGCDLSIVIRTIVMDGRRTTIGAGGAIVMQSDPEGEFEELLLKAQAPMRALALCATGAPEWRVLDPAEAPSPADVLLEA